MKSALALLLGAGLLALGADLSYLSALLIALGLRIVLWFKD